MHRHSGSFRGRKDDLVARIEVGELFVIHAAVPTQFHPHAVSVHRKGRSDLSAQNARRVPNVPQMQGYGLLPSGLIRVSKRCVNQTGITRNLLDITSLG
jgi:hypothetical protein